MKAGELVAHRRDEIARLITLDSDLCLKDAQYEVGRASSLPRQAAVAAYPCLYPCFLHVPLPVLCPFF